MQHSSIFAQLEMQVLPLVVIPALPNKFHMMAIKEHLTSSACRRVVLHRNNQVKANLGYCLVIINIIIILTVICRHAMY